MNTPSSCWSITSGQNSSLPSKIYFIASTLGSKTPTVYAQWLSKACDITSFTLPNQLGTTTISGGNIGVTVPSGTDVTALIPTITVSDGATVSPASGVSTDFTNPVAYTVIAKDRVATKTYTVTVTTGAQATYAVAVSGGTGSGSYTEGDTVDITADTPPAGQEFDKWTSSDVTFANETAETTSFVMPAKTVNVTATYKASPPTPVTRHTITLGASGDGTVTGGGTFDENSNITVTATPNAGNSFINWTENDVGVSTLSSYSFAVTSARTLIAHFNADDAPEPPVDPPTKPSYSGRSSSSGGSNKADTSPMVLTVRAFTKADATKLFNTALANKPEGQTTLSIRARNYTKVDKSVLAELAALAKKNGVTLTVHFDTEVNRGVVYRVSVNPAAATTNLDLTVKIVGGKLSILAVDTMNSRPITYSTITGSLFLFHFLVSLGYALSRLHRASDTSFLNKTNASRSIRTGVLGRYTVIPPVGLSVYEPI